MSVVAPPRPLELRPPASRLLKHPRLMHYFRLIAVVLLVNVAVLLSHLDEGDWAVDDGSAATAMSNLAVVNITVAVVFRQQHVVNALYALASRLPRSWPKRVRWTASKVHHIGGVHVGAATAGTLWLVGSTVVLVVARGRDATAVPLSTLVLSVLLVGLTVVIVACAVPVVRTRWHNVFETTHRLGGWTAVILFWALTVDVVVRHRVDETVAQAVATDWRTLLLGLVTVIIVLPWTRLRRVPVSVERPSSHAVILTFDYGVTPPVAAIIGLSLNPLREWHSFAAIPTPGRTGYRLLVSRVGDWTGAFIDDPPSHVWVKGFVTESPLTRVEALFPRVVVVATGSGIGPILSQILARRVPSRLVWSTRSPRATYGDALVDEIMAAQPDALIWDTTVQGRADVVQLTERACREFDADAVFVVSNKKTTWRVVHAMERLGVPSIGPIFDS